MTLGVKIAVWVFMALSEDVSRLIRQGRLKAITWFTYFSAPFLLLLEEVLDYLRPQQTTWWEFYIYYCNQFAPLTSLG